MAVGRVNLGIPFLTSILLSCDLNICFDRLKADGVQEELLKSCQLYLSPSRNGDNYFVSSSLFTYFTKHVHQTSPVYILLTHIFYYLLFILRRVLGPVFALESLITHRSGFDCHKGLRIFLVTKLYR